MIAAFPNGAKRTRLAIHSEKADRLNSPSHCLGGFLVERTARRSELFNKNNVCAFRVGNPSPPTTPFILKSYSDVVPSKCSSASSALVGWITSWRCSGGPYRV